MVELDDRATIPVFCKPPGRRHDAVPLLATKQYIPKRISASKRITVQKPVFIKRESQTFVNITLEQEYLVLIEPSERLLFRHMHLTGAGADQLKPANCAKHLWPTSATSDRLWSNQVVAVVSKHTTQLVEFDYFHGQLFGVIEEGKMYRKHRLNVKNIGVITASLSNDLDTSQLDKKDDFKGITVKNV